MERSNQSTAQHEQQEAESGKVEKFLSKIKDFKDKIADKMGISGEQLTEMTDAALVDAARDTISDADTDGERTDAESSEINDAVSSVIVQGAMEKAGYDQSSGENPILSLDNEDTESDLISSIATLHKEEVALPTGEDVAELAAMTIEDAKWSRMVQVDRAHGSNPGGWYEYPSTDERYYVKFYKNPDQGRVEYVANAVYAKLVIKAVRTEIAQIDGREAVASAAIEGAKDTYKEDQIASADVQKGFVADAFLANWDVVGAVADNIVQGDDGGFYRIDNGGSLIFRAQGGVKEYSANSIPELETMRDHRFSSGDVFAGITEDDIVEQAQALLDNLSEDDIREIIEQSGLTDKAHDAVLNGMLGRRKYLERLCAEANVEVVESGDAAERHEVVTDGRVSEKINELRGLGPEQIGDYIVFRRGEITCDHDHIEGQKLNIYDKSPAGRVEVTFKLRDTADGAREQLYEQLLRQAGTDRHAAISCWHMNKEGDAEAYKLCDAISFSRGDVKVYVAKPDTNVRTALGMVKIEAPSDMSSEDIEKAVADVLENDLKIPGALGEVPADAEEDYKRARYGWEHRKYELYSEDYEAAAKLESVEVAPGYTTMVEPGKHNEYEAKYGDVRAYHVLYSQETNTIVSTLMSGLLCSSERYQRGIFDDGMSTSKDLLTGGGDSVFTRVAKKGHAEDLTSTTIIFKPELFDRTDWYSYDVDRYGSTEDDEYPKRISPDELFTKLTSGALSPNVNEQMFRTGIGADYIESIRVNPAQRDEILDSLREKGVSEIGGRAIEEIVVANENYIAPRPVDPAFEEEWADDSHQISLEISKLATLEKKDGLLDGSVEYSGVEDILDLCETIDDVVALFDAVSEHGYKDKLKTDVSMYIVNNIDSEAIQAFQTGAFNVEDAVSVILKYAQEKLEIDLDNIIDIKKKWNK
jgi:hypothetical protein